MTIRPATASDARAIAELLCALPEYPRYREMGLEVLEPKLKAAFHHEGPRTVLVAELEGRVIGYIAAHWISNLALGAEGYISELFVRAEASGRGAGGALLQTIIREARTRGCRRVTLNNWRDRESYRRGFYTKHGFKEIPEAARFVLMLEPNP